MGGIFPHGHSPAAVSGDWRLLPESQMWELMFATGTGVSCYLTTAMCNHVNVFYLAGFLVFYTIMAISRQTEARSRGRTMSYTLIE